VETYPSMLTMLVRCSYRFGIDLFNSGTGSRESPSPAVIRQNSRDIKLTTEV
jgi:hypothetical protein